MHSEASDSNGSFLGLHVAKEVFVITCRYFRETKKTTLNILISKTPYLIDVTVQVKIELKNLQNYTFKEA